MKYYIIAGEASGDLHGSNLIKGLRAEDPQAEFRLWGGSLMAEAAEGRGTLVRDYRSTAVMGLGDVIKSAGRIFSNLRLCKKDILGWKPDVVIPIDYPGFNMKIAGFCHSRGIKVFYYIVPKTWASREGRNEKLKKWCDRLFIVFPFEIPYFESRGMDFIYRGNPLIDAVDSHEYKAPYEGHYIAMLPGSRKGEISRMMPICMEIADRLGRQVIIAGAPARNEADYEPYIAGRKNVKLMFSRTYDILKFADAAIVNSGTASLEAALIGTPQVVCWNTSALTYWAAVNILKVQNHIKFISLGNLILDRLAFKELIQDDFSADNVCREIGLLTGDSDYRGRMIADYAEIRKALGGKGASLSVARAMIESLK